MQALQLQFTGGEEPRQEYDPKRCEMDRCFDLIMAALESEDPVAVAKAEWDDACWILYEECWNEDVAVAVDEDGDPIYNWYYGDDGRIYSNAEAARKVVIDQVLGQGMDYSSAITWSYGLEIADRNGIPRYAVREDFDGLVGAMRDECGRIAEQWEEAEEAIRS